VKVHIYVIFVFGCEILSSLTSYFLLRFSDFLCFQVVFHQNILVLPGVVSHMLADFL
jgi:hypothetical protein